ncbi:MAG: phosphoribulokinase [Ectothiorhodospiraceae bacterium]|nr:phosphoribulokinase [Ectothiorhodospiraceae bacterium]MCH8503778.1 phosphoribulokinase [Ectothiorhodospiraceae bacterium]
MSAMHPIVAVTGSSGAGTSTVKSILQRILRRDQFKAAFVEGDSFHRYNRAEMKRLMVEHQEEGRNLSHFGPEANLFEELEQLFREYGEKGTGRFRHYIHNQEESLLHDTPSGTFTEWADFEPDTDLLFYEGLHGAVKTETVNVGQHVDLLVGVTPIINLEWIQKIHRDTSERGHMRESVTETILRRLPDYINYIAPQFTSTDINFQRVPTVDTSNPFIAREIPSLDESHVVIRFRNPKKFHVDFPFLLAMIPGSFMSRRNTIVIPGGKMGFALEIILQPLIEKLVLRARENRRVELQAEVVND